MLFNSYIYIFLFLPIVAFVYFFLNKQRLVTMAKIWLVFASFMFYTYWNPKYLSILIFSIIFNFAIGSSFNYKNIKTKISSKAILIFGIIVNLLLLGYFKYMDFFIENLNAICKTDISLFKIVLPLGISFFTFQQITYLVDSYKNETKEYDFLNYALFVSFFPQLIAGPIVHHKEMIPQFQNIKTKVINHKNLILGMFIFTLGLFKKVVLADTFSTYVNTGFGIDNISMLEAWITSLSYTLQIYFDFSGYCDMAIGSALLFNIKLPMNFNSPYKSESIQEFWSRWHITFSRFLKEYIYFPLGGSKKGEVKTYSNILVTFLVSGFWHGANWTFILWGILHGIGLCINRLFRKTKISFYGWINVLITFISINFLWVIFRAENISQGIRIWQNMINFSNVILPKTYHTTLKFIDNAFCVEFSNILIFLPLGLILVFALMNSTELISKIRLNSKKKTVLITLLFSLLFLFCIIKMVYLPYSEFIYFNF